MKITYIYHSCFLIEFDKCYFLFDYFKGDLPQLDINKRIYVFASHSHHDHFNIEIFNVLMGYDAVFIFADEIKNVKADLFVAPNKSYTVDNIEIKTLKSTDLGVAFIIKYDNTTLYHAGDLNDWVWPGESQAYNEKMTKLYRKEISKIEDNIDVAFLPLDTRQEKWYYCGMKYFVENVKVKKVFPMHFWDDFSLTDKFVSDYFYSDVIKFYTIKEYNQSWEV